MTTHRLLPALFLLTPLLSGCTQDPVDTGPLGPFEGDEPGECTDGADNDRDDYFDCADSDCFGSPDCGGSETDADADADTDADADADTDTDAESPYTAATVGYTLDWDIDGQWGAYGYSDCTQVYSGDGVLVDSSAGRVTFYGAWRLDSSGCASDLDTTVWADASGQGYTSLHFTDSYTTLDAWVVHESAENHVADGKPDAKFYISQMDAAIISDAAEHVETEDIYLEGAYYFATLTHTLQIALE